MIQKYSRRAVTFVIAIILLVCQQAQAEPVKGIYITQTTVEDTSYFKYLISRAKAVGINTFVADLEIKSKRYEKNITLLKDNGIRYVARIIVFPQGGKPGQIASEAYWAKRFELVKTAVAYGAQEVQLDYIRYNTKQFASAENAKQIKTVVHWFREHLDPNIPLQADVFGISSFGESKHIGQNLKLMAESVNALCPMVYPSHFEPYRVHAVTPYQTIYNSLRALQKQFNNQLPVKVYAYIEISNYRYPLPGAKRRNYVLAQMKAVKDAGADGFFVWSAHNKYDFLFDLMGEINKTPAILEDHSVMRADANMIKENEVSTPSTHTKAASVPAYILADAKLKNPEENVQKADNNMQQAKPVVPAASPEPKAQPKLDSAAANSVTKSNLSTAMALSYRWPLSTLDHQTAQ